MGRALSELDIDLFRLLHQELSGAWLLPMAVLSTIGGGWGSLALLPLCFWARTRRFALTLVGVLAVTATLVFFAKRLARRPRPPVLLEDIHARIFEAPTDFSFPSGHAAGSFAFAFFVAVVLLKTAPPGALPQLFRLVAGLALLLLAGGVGLSRVALGVHFPGDVLTGALVGMTVAWAGARLHLGRSGAPAAAPISRSFDPFWRSLRSRVRRGNTTPR